MENINDTIIYWPAVRIIVHENEMKEILVNLDELKRNGEEDGYPNLTLTEISDQLQKNGYGFTYYVWAESGLSGDIYQFGNYDPPSWQEHGTTKGYA